MPYQSDVEQRPTIAPETQVFEDNFNTLSQIINQYPVTNYTNNDSNEIVTDNSTSSNNDQEQTLTQKFKYCQLSMFCCIFFIYGCQTSLLGSALPDLTKLLHTTSESISIAISIKNFLSSISTILVSFSFEIFGNRQLQFAGAVFTFGLISALTPFMTSFKQFLIGFFFTGICSALIDSVTNLVVLELFSLNSKVYMQISHGSFTFGSIFGPLLIGPFLSKNDNSTNPSNHSDHIITTTTLAPITTLSPNITNHLAGNSLNEFFHSMTNWMFQDENEFETRIYIPYLIVSIMLILASIVVVLMQIFFPYVPQKRKLQAKQKSKRVVEPLEEQIQDSFASSSSAENSQTHTRSVDNDSIENSSVNNVRSSTDKKRKTENVCQQINLPPIYYRIFLGLTGLLLAVYCSVDGLTGFFMVTFLSKGELQFEKDQAAFMLSLVYTSMAIGRLMTIIFALKTTCKIFLFFNFSMILVGYITLTFFAVHSKLISLIAMILIGFGLSSTYPLTLSYIENRIVITNTVQLYLIFMSSILQCFIPVIVGHFIDINAMVFVYSVLTLAITALILMLCIHGTDIWKRELIKRIKEDQQNLVGEDV